MCVKSQKGNMHFFGCPRAEIPWPIEIKFFIIDYVREITQCAKNGLNWFRRLFPTYVNMSFLVHYAVLTLPYLTLPYLFSWQRLQTALVYQFWRSMAQKTWSGVRKRLLGVALLWNNGKGSKISKTPIFGPLREFPAKWKTWNNFWTVRETNNSNGQHYRNAGLRNRIVLTCPVCNAPSGRN